VTTPSGNLSTNAYWDLLGFAEYTFASFGPIAFFIEGVSAGTSKRTAGFKGILPHVFANGFKSAILFRPSTLLTLKTYDDLNQITKISAVPEMSEFGA
jgi:hypothetical protein